jgi:hypothetical protein
MRFLEDFEKGVGTYLKVVRVPQPSNPDAFLVLYLRPDGRFLFAGYWSGYERSVAAGIWTRRGNEVHLKGHGQLSTDSIPGPDGGPFERVLTVEGSHSTPSLVAATELQGWSLLSWRGHYTYVGQSTVINPDGGWLPDSQSAVDAWIEKILQQ